MKICNKEFSDFLIFLLEKTYKPENQILAKPVLDQTFGDVVKDVRYHFPETDEISVWERIISNSNELAIWLYRLGRNLWLLDNAHPLLRKIHWLLKELCSSEIYFSSFIDTGFYVFHGEGLVIGSRNVIGKGLRVYQNVTIGHKNINSLGLKIGDNVRIYAGAKVIGSMSIGDNVIVGANTVLTKGAESNTIVYGNPNIVKSAEGTSLI